MRIGIVGTRGIPNQYGGFEQFAEFVSPALAARGHEVFIYSSSLHPYKETSWKGVQLIRKYDPENRIGTAGQFIYDLNCILHIRRMKPDIILQLGYTSSSIWSFLFPGKSLLVTNMDGLEWKRSKYSGPVQKFLRYAEKWAALYSDRLIADSKGIQAYLTEKYNKPSAFIAYGATPFLDPDERIPGCHGLSAYEYNLVIARMEPENNVETILRGHRQSAKKHKLVLIGNHTNAFGSYLKKTYEDEMTLFPGALYDLGALNNLRYFSNLYFHGHSVGGTNPSLLEAMASQSLVAAHDNIFNRSVLEEDAFYFSGPGDIAALLERQPHKQEYAGFLQNNMVKIKNDYSWEHITDLLENYLSDSLRQR
jgi:glycosyltransferase involved in cell wall biosynthesis